MTNLERWQNQLNRLCRNNTVPEPPKKPLTGIDKQRLEEEEAKELWKELRDGQ